MTERSVLKAKDWKLLLQRALDGKRNAALDHLGGLDELLRVEIANSADASESRVELHEALDDIIPSWEWRPTARLHAAAMMLDVFRAFQPRLGGPKTVQLLHNWKAGTSVLEVYPERYIDVRLLAVRVLERYYPTPLDNSREWDAYVNVLYELLAHAEQPTYVIARLRQIDTKEFTARAEATMADTKVLDRVVQKLIDERNAEADDALSVLYSLCVPHREAEFEHAVKLAGGTVEVKAETPIIQVDKTTIAVDPTEEDMWEAMETASVGFAARLEIYVPATGTSGNGHSLR